VISKKGLETRLEAEDKYPDVANPLTVDCKEAEEIYPSVPSPCVVLTKLLAKPRLLMKLTVPSPMTVDVNSVGSIKEEIKFCKPMVVLCRLLAKVKLLTKFAADDR
jgi:hypothetical protein